MVLVGITTANVTILYCKTKQLRGATVTELPDAKPLKLVGCYPPWGKKGLSKCRRGFRPFQTIFYTVIKLNGVTMQKERRKTTYTLENSYKNASSVFSFTPAVACHKCLLIWYSLKVDNSATQLHCHFVGGASQLVHSAIHSMCKSFRASPFMLLIVPYNSVYYYYYALVGWLVGWLVLESRQNRGLRLQKRKVHCGPMSCCDYKC